MLIDTRQKDANWKVTNNEGLVANWDAAQLAVLMDIRDELKKLNRLLHCDNFTDIPRILRRISAHTAKPRKVNKP